MNSQSDEELMERYKDGDEAGFQEIYERYSSKIYSFLNSRVFDKNIVGEIMQEVFIKVHKSRNLYNNSFPLAPWLFTITRNVMIDELRKTQIKGSEINNLDAEEPIDISDQIEELAPLPQNVIKMRYVEEKTFKEIGEQLGTSEVNARKMLSRAVKNLKEIISEKDNER